MSSKRHVKITMHLRFEDGTSRPLPTLLSELDAFMCFVLLLAADTEWRKTLVSDKRFSVITEWFTVHKRGKIPWAWVVKLALCHTAMHRPNLALSIGGALQTEDGIQIDCNQLEILFKQWERTDLAGACGETDPPSPRLRGLRNWMEMAEPYWETWNEADYRSALIPQDVALKDFRRQLRKISPSLPLFKVMKVGIGEIQNCAWRAQAGGLDELLRMELRTGNYYIDFYKVARLFCAEMGWPIRASGKPDLSISDSTAADALSLLEKLVSSSEEALALVVRDEMDGVRMELDAQFGRADAATRAEWEHWKSKHMGTNETRAQLAAKYGVSDWKMRQRTAVIEDQVARIQKRESQ